MADVETDTIAEPDTTPAADPVADVETDTIAEPDTTPAASVADVETDTIAEPDTTPAEPVADVEPDPVPATEGAGLLGHRGKSKVWAGEYDQYRRITTAAPAEVLKGDYIIIESGRQDPDVLRVVEPAHSDGGFWGRGSGVRDTAGTKTETDLLKKYSDAYNNRNADVEDVPADAPAVDTEPAPTADTEPVADMDYEAVETAAETVSREVAEHPDRRARRVARTGDEIEREYGLKTLDGRSIEEMQANIANAKAALDAGEFDDDPDVRKEVQRILHFADQIDRRRTAALAEQEPVAEPEYIAADAMAEPDPVAEPDTVSGETPPYDSWRKRQLDNAETVFPTEERDALVSRLIDADEKLNRAEGRSEEWLAEQREDLADSYNDRDSAIGEVGARNEKQWLLQLVTKFEAMAAEAEPKGATLGDGVPAEEPEPVVAPEPIAQPDAMPADAVADVESESAPTAPVAPTVAQYENAFRAFADYPRQVQDEVEVNAWTSLQKYPPDVREIAEANMKAALELVKGAPAQEPDAVPADAMAEPEPDTIEETAATVEPDAVPADAMAEPTTAGPAPEGWDALPSDTQQRVLEMVKNAIEGTRTRYSTVARITLAYSCNPR